jgi:two-component system nitrate/nitrite response regulator NarL
MKLLIVDDHPVVRDGLSRLLASSEPDIEVLLAEDCVSGMALAAAQPDLDAIFMDLNLPGLSGAQAIREFGLHCPAVPVIVLSSSEDAHDVRSALAAGALGYVPKSASVKTLMAALKLVLSGEIYLPPLLLTAAETAAAPPQALTDRQMDVLRLLADGHANKQIARTLDIAEKTVKAHVSAIFRFLNVDNRTQAVTVAHKSGLL